MSPGRLHGLHPWQPDRDCHPRPARRTLETGSRGGRSERHPGGRPSRAHALAILLLPIVAMATSCSLSPTPRPPGFCCARNDLHGALFWVFRQSHADSERTGRQRCNSARAIASWPRASTAASASHVRRALPARDGSSLSHSEPHRGPAMLVAFTTMFFLRLGPRSE